MPDPIRSSAPARVADTLLRAAAGREVILRLPAPASSLVSEQLGLATPYFQDVPLAPVVFRKARFPAPVGKPAPVELLVSATVIERIVGTLQYDSPRVLFANAMGVLIDEVLFAIASATPEQAFGKAYLYRLVLYAPVAETV